MDDSKRLERIEKKLDDSNEHLASIDVTLMSQHVSLKDHMRRTQLLEQELRPIRTHVSRVEGALKLIALAAALATIIELMKK